MNNYAFWQKEWKEKAKLENAFEAMGARSIVQNPIEFLHMLSDVREGLQLKSSDRLLDVGCNTGIFPIALATSVKKIDGIEFVPQFVAIARKNCGPYKNITIGPGNILRIPFAPKTFDKVLVGSVLHYLNDQAAVGDALRELNRVTKKGGVVLATLIPDAAHKDAYLDGIAKLPLPAARKKDIYEKNSRGLWLDRKELQKAAKAAGFKAQIVPVRKEIWQSWYMFSLRLTKI